MFKATFVVPPRLPRSLAEPSASHSTAWGPTMRGNNRVFAHEPDVPMV
jgi:hypothetical protein